MRSEQGFYVFASAVIAVADHTSPTHEFLLWAASGTLMGSFLASMAGGKSKTPAFGRMLIAFVAGLIIAPWFIGYLPKPTEVPELFHVFGSSGISAACGYMIFTEYPKIILDRLRGLRYNAPSINRKERDDNDDGNESGSGQDRS